MGLLRSSGTVGLAATLASCSNVPSIPRQDTALALRAVQATLAACTRPLGPDGNHSEAALIAAGWTPQRRTFAAMVTRDNTVGSEERAVPPARPSPLRSAEEHEYSEWSHPGWEGRIHLSRQGGAISERAMGQCGASYAGRDATTAEQALTAMTQALGPPVGRRERPMGGDFLTPRWFEPTTVEVYWRLPYHDVYWVSANGREVTVEVRAMPDRAQLDEFSRDRPAEEYGVGLNRSR